MSNSSIFIASLGIKPWLLALWVMLSGACVAQVQQEPASMIYAPGVITLKLSFSNVHVIRNTPPVLIDAGSPTDWQSLSEQLAVNQIKICDIRWVIITHAHQDHAGLASLFQQKCGTKIAMHQQDVRIAEAGGFDPDLKFTGLMSRVVWKLVNYRYPPFKPDVAWNIAAGESVDLAALGIAGRAVSVPGHTPGSLAIALNDGRAFIGDMMAGGYLGGALHATQASEHYFHGDSALNYRWLRALLDMGLHTFYIGHGGPLLRDTVVEATQALSAKEHRDTPIHSQRPPFSQPSKESP